MLHSRVADEVRAWRMVQVSLKYLSGMLLQYGTRYVYLLFYELLGCPNLQA
jgi:hypothetical protein